MQRITYKEFLPEVLGRDLIRKFNLEILDQGRFTGYDRNEDASVV